MKDARTAGFRLSISDSIVLAAGSVAAVLAIRPLGPVAGVVPMVVGHFFLFCNVFRIRRKYELVWAGVFLANFGAWTFAEEIRWSGILAIQLPLTALLIGMEMRSPRYHGIFAERLNPRLNEWLAGDR